MIPPMQTSSPLFSLTLTLALTLPASLKKTTVPVDRSCQVQMLEKTNVE